MEKIRLSISVYILRVLFSNIQILFQDETDQNNISVQSNNDYLPTTFGYFI